MLTASQISQAVGGHSLYLNFPGPISLSPTPAVLKRSTSVGTRVEGFAAELPRQQDIAATAAPLARDHRQFGITGREPRENRRLLRRRQRAAYIDERPTGADRRELTRVADQHQTLNAFDCVQQRRQLILGQHNAVVTWVLM
jgi:hypothetical protein